MSVPLVSVVVPARDEEGSIGRCIEHLAAQDHPLDRLEVLVVDGASSDRTAATARAALARHPFARGEVLPNPEATTPSNLNVGVRAATGEVVCRVDARSLVPSHYVRCCVEVLARREVAVVGGAPRGVASDSASPVAVGIARAYNNRWTTGLSRYQRGRGSGPSDTVYLGAFRRAELVAVGGWDERMAANQDFDLNRRMAARGLVWFDERLAVPYVVRGDLASLHRHFVRLGRGKASYWAVTGDRPQPRQLLLLAAPPIAAVAGIGLLGALRPRARLGALVAAAIAAVGVEVVGSDEPSATPRGHAAGVAAIAAMDLGWLRGVLGGLASQLLRRSPPTT